MAVIFSRSQCVNGSTALCAISSHFVNDKASMAHCCPWVWIAIYDARFTGFKYKNIIICEHLSRKSRLDFVYGLQETRKTNHVSKQVMDFCIQCCKDQLSFIGFLWIPISCVIYYICHSIIDNRRSWLERRLRMTITVLKMATIYLELSLTPIGPWEMMYQFLKCICQTHQQTTWYCQAITEPD